MARLGGRVCLFVCLLGKSYTCKSAYGTKEYKIYITHIQITEDNTKKHKTYFHGGPLHSIQHQMGKNN